MQPKKKGCCKSNCFFTNVLLLVPKNNDKKLELKHNSSEYKKKDKF